MRLFAPYIACALALNPLLASPTMGADAARSGLRRLTVDVAVSTGRLRSLQGVNGAPAPGMHKPENFTFGGWNMPAHINVRAGYREARIDLVRTHDAYGPGDIDARFETADAPGGGLISAQRDVLSIFPNPDADANDPRSYNFGPTDELISSIRGLGAQAIFRLGRSEGADPSPPKSFAKYAAVAKHIVLHYNQGWAQGFHYGIRYWEIWNEPDLGRMFWAGTAQQYFELYGRLARAVKEADPKALVGGPAIARPNDDTPYRDAFLEYVRGEDLPLDFYSWHWYATDSDDPLDFIRIARDIRARLDKHGFQQTRSMVTEWNYGLLDPPPAAMQRASFVTTALIYMQDAPVDASALYRADNVFGRDGATPDKTGQALILLGKMKDTPIRVRSDGADLNGLAVQAGRSTDGHTIHVLLSNYQIPAAFLGPRTADDVLHVPPVFDVRLLARRSVTYHNNGGYDLTIDHLPSNKHFVVERCRISASEDLRLTREPARTAGGKIHLRGTLAPPGIELVTLRAATGSDRVPETAMASSCGASAAASAANSSTVHPGGPG